MARKTGFWHASLGCVARRAGMPQAAYSGRTRPTVSGVWLQQRMRTAGPHAAAVLGPGSNPPEWCGAVSARSQMLSECAAELELTVA